MGIMAPACNPAVQITASSAKRSEGFLRGIEGREVHPAGHRTRHDASERPEGNISSLRLFNSLNVSLHVTLVVTCVCVCALCVCVRVCCAVHHMDVEG